MGYLYLPACTLPPWSQVSFLPSFPPSMMWTCPAQPLRGTHTHGSRGNWVMLTEPQCAQSQYPGFCLGSVCYNFLQVIYKSIWGWCEYVLHRAEIGAAVQGTQKLVLHGCGAVGWVCPLDIPMWAPMQKNSWWFYLEGLLYLLRWLTLLLAKT